MVTRIIGSFRSGRNEAIQLCARLETGDFACFMECTVSNLIHHRFVFDQRSIAPSGHCCIVDIFYFLISRSAFSENTILMRCFIQSNSNIQIFTQMRIISYQLGPSPRMLMGLLALCTCFIGYKCYVLQLWNTLHKNTAAKGCTQTTCVTIGPSPGTGGSMYEHAVFPKIRSQQAGRG